MVDGQNTEPPSTKGSHHGVHHLPQNGRIHRRTPNFAPRRHRKLRWHTAIKVAERIRTELAISARFLRSLAAAGVMDKADVQRHTPNSTTHAAASEGLSDRVLRAQRGSMRRL